MKIKAVRELETKYLGVRLEAKGAKHHQMKLNHAVTHLENRAQIKAALQHNSLLNHVHHKMGVHDEK